MAVNQNTHVRHKGAHPGSGNPMNIFVTIFVNFRNVLGKAWEREKFKMSAEEDTELRDMVAQTLESKGVLGKIRVRKYAFLNKVEGGFIIIVIKVNVVIH